MATRYSVELIGRTPLIMHQDSVEQADLIKSWRDLPKNKKEAKGDDRSPVFTWKTYLYVNIDGTRVCIPSTNILSAMSKAGASFKEGKGSKTSLKSATQSMIAFENFDLDFFCCGKPITINDINAISDDFDFEKHKEMAKALGINLEVKRASIGMSKHVRVRPVFHNWSASGTIQVFDEGVFNKKQLDELFELCGLRVGLGDWRPSAPKKPGPFGTFTTKIKEI
jgi:hypothetical protein